MPRFARAFRSRLAAVAVAAVTTCLPACRSVSPESGDMVAASAIKSEHSENWIGWAPTPAPGQATPRPAATPGPIQQAQVTLQRQPGVVVPTDAVVTAPGAPAPLPAQPLPGGPTAVVACGPNGCAPGGDQSDRFWGRSRGWSDAACGSPRGFDQPADRPDWQNLPRMFGDQGRPNSGIGASTPTDIASGGPFSRADFRSGFSDVDGATPFANVRAGVELANAEGTGSIGAVGGLSTLEGTSTGLAPSLYAKRVITSSDDGMFGVGFGGTIPSGPGARGDLFPWVFGARRVTGDTWVQGVTGVSIPFSSSQDFGAYFDYGLVIPVYGRNSGPRGMKMYFMPELHANVALSKGSGGNVLTQRYGNPGFVLNSTLGLGARVRSIDIQAGIAFPLLSERFYDYESILRFTYNF